jgi:nucleotide-binding universal stress UspA family protein
VPASRSACLRMDIGSGSDSGINRRTSIIVALGSFGVFFFGSAVIMLWAQIKNRNTMSANVILGRKMELYRRILVPTDGSEYTMAATNHGLALAKLAGAEVTALFVIDDEVYLSKTWGPMMPTAVPDLTRLLEEEGGKAVAKVLSEGERLGVKVVTKIERGSPASTIIKDSANFDLIVMGSLGRSGVSKFLMGSVAEKVVRFAECPVLVVKKAKGD